MADKPSPDASSNSSEFHSKRVERLRVAMETLDVNDEQAKAKVEIKFSEAHWSEPARFYDATETIDSSSTPLYDAAETVDLSSRPLYDAVETLDSSSTPHKWFSKAGTLEWELEVAKDNKLVFRKFQEKYPCGFFIDENDLGPDSTQQLPMWLRGEDSARKIEEFVLSSETPFAEGGQADLFHVHFDHPSGRDWASKTVMKVYKEGMPFRDLFKSISTNMLDNITRAGHFGYYDANFTTIRCALLLKSSRRFAFLIHRAWGDLRKLIEVRLVHFKSPSQPFPDDVALKIINQIAKGMMELHQQGIIHRDLKASNVLVFVGQFTGLLGRSHTVDPIHLPREFECRVADYECAAGIVGTGFWRAPEVLEVLKVRSVPPKLFTKQVDVYSFGMTCYEILSGRMPFEDLEPWDYDGVIGGERPTLPSRTRCWMSKLIERCWHKDPSKRPPFEEIVKILAVYVREGWDYGEREKDDYMENGKRKNRERKNGKR